MFSTPGRRVSTLSTFLLRTCPHGGAGVGDAALGEVALAEPAADPVPRELPAPSPPQDRGATLRLLATPAGGKHSPLVKGHDSRRVLGPATPPTPPHWFFPPGDTCGEARALMKHLDTQGRIQKKSLPPPPSDFNPGITKGSAAPWQPRCCHLPQVLLE